MDLTDGIKNAIEEKLGRLDFYLHPETDVKVTVSAKKARQKVEVTIIPINGPIKTEIGIMCKFISKPIKE